MVRRALIAGLVAAAAAASAAADVSLAERAFARGNERYLEGDPRGAIEEYLAAGEALHSSAALTYNLGNAYLKAGEPARAIAAYERARALAPRDPDVAFNLAHAKDLLGRRYGDEVLRQNEEVARTFDSPLARLTAGEVAGAFLAVYVPFGLLLVAWTATGRRALGRAAAALGALALVVGIALAAHHFLYDAVPRGVLLGGLVDIKSGPDERYTTTFTVHEGLLVRVEEERPGWLRVQLANGLVGWVPDTKVAWVRRPAA